VFLGSGGKRGSEEGEAKNKDDEMPSVRNRFHDF
jgi:hypothetical protein